MEDPFQIYSDKTRVLILTKEPAIASLFFSILKFNDKDFDFEARDGQKSNSGADFIILETEDLVQAELFQPNIAFVTNEFSETPLMGFCTSVVAGGVLIYPQEKEVDLELTTNFFRKLAYGPTNYQIKNSHSTFESSFGEIPLNGQNEQILQNMAGLQLLAQQFGILEEAFYEPLMSFEW